MIATINAANATTPLSIDKKSGILHLPLLLSSLMEFIIFLNIPSPPFFSLRCPPLCEMI